MGENDSLTREERMDLFFARNQQADNAEPVTAEWIVPLLERRWDGWFPSLIYLEWNNGMILVSYDVRRRLEAVKTRGDVRELCRLLGITLEETSNG